MADSSNIDGGSFRDPSGHIYRINGKIFRTVSAVAASAYEFVRNSGALSEWAEQGLVLGVQETDFSVLGPVSPEVRYVLEHPTLPFVSYPYEWPFQALKTAALFHLDLQMKALARDITLSDASAYNVQFLGSRPVFIDHLSFKPYQEGEFWTGHKQFCEQFLNPLLLRALLGVSYNGWYRGNLEGITAVDLNSLLPLHRKLSWNVFSHVTLQARGQKKAIEGKKEKEIKALRHRKLPRRAYLGMLSQLRNWIVRLEPANTGKTVWGDYATTHSYSSEEAKAKHAFVAEFVRKTKPCMLWDLGCNTGDYAETALRSGAERIIGFDFDQEALDRAFLRAQEKNLNFLPLFLDATNPSPNQGWNCQERAGFQARASADALLALAFEHHLAIGRNVPLDYVVKWLVDLAPIGIIEFTPKDDPTIQKMLALREDIFPNYSEENFVCALKRHARVVGSKTVSATGRRLFIYDRL